MQAVADALSLLANIVMAWNTTQMQAGARSLGHTGARSSRRTHRTHRADAPEGINLRGVFRFPIERYVARLLPSQTAAKTSAMR